MKHYFDVKIKATKSLNVNAAMAQLYSALHSYLSLNKVDNIGVSFPCLKLDLGDTLRLHSDKQALTNINESGWLNSVSSFVSVGVIGEAQNIKGYQRVSRQQSKMSPSRLRRLEKRGNRSPEELSNYRKLMAASTLSNPYLDLQSTSTGQRYRKFFKFEEITEEISGKFNEFGLSKEATIPLF